MTFHRALAAAAFSTASLASLGLVGSINGCAAQANGDGTVVAADDSAPERGGESVTTALAVGSVLKATTGVNLRSSASTSASIYHVVPAGALVTVVESSPQGGFYKVKHAGVEGWSYGKYYDFVSAPSSGGGTTGGGTTGGGTTGGGTSGGTARDEAIARAKSGVGFSYWWGHGRWQPGGATSSNAGSCSGSCPSCSHGGTNGADCSGFVGKVWQVPSSNSDLTVDEHPYSTASFVGNSSLWSTVSRGSLIAADALVYNSGGEGHIVLFESGDGWGSMWTYEARGCATGIVHNIRTAGSAFKGIRRTGY